MKIVLAGAGAFALEVEQYILDCNGSGRGLLDSDGCVARLATLAGVHFTGHGRLDDFQTRSLAVLAADAELPADVHFLVAIGSAEARRQVWHALRARSARFATLVHPTAVLAATARIGSGTILCPFAFIGPLVTLGQNVLLNTYASIGHDGAVGDHSVLSPYACVNGHGSLGEACFLGSRAVVTPQRRIGAFSKISAGAIAFNDAEPGTLLLGNPAKGRRFFAIPNSPE
jgi:sugar O-acyltransferase (sialic acid O-acetyltransferase NeuD family)